METKSLIINIAKKLFQLKGYKGVDLNEIIKECNITQGSLYYHFSNGKEEWSIICIALLKKAAAEPLKGISN